MALRAPSGESNRTAVCCAVRLLSAISIAGLRKRSGAERECYKEGRQATSPATVKPPLCSCFGSRVVAMYRFCGYFRFRSSTLFASLSYNYYHCCARSCSKYRVQPPPFWREHRSLSTCVVSSGIFSGTEVLEDGSSFSGGFIWIHSWPPA